MKKVCYLNLSSFVEERSSMLRIPHNCNNLDGRAETGMNEGKTTYFVYIWKSFSISLCKWKNYFDFEKLSNYLKSLRWLKTKDSSISSFRRNSNELLLSFYQNKTQKQREGRCYLCSCRWTFFMKIVKKAKHKKKIWKEWKSLNITIKKRKRF